MRKNVTKVAAALLSAAMVVTSVSVPGTTSEAATVKISASKATIYSGGPAAKKKVSLTVKKGSTNLTKKCTWTSSKKAVATVGKKTGKVTAKKAGKTVIKAKYGKKTYKCTVTVKAYKYATKLTVSPTSKTLTVGKTQKITVKYTGSPTTKGVTFKSSKAAVAAVSAKGVITAKKAGTAKITVKTKANVAKKTLSKTITVTVKAAATATATPAATAAPASEAPATEAPATTAPTTAPSAAPTTAPTASAQPSKDPKIAKEVAKIVITSKEALTNPADDETGLNAGQKAYVYYKVLNAYGDDITDANDIQWTTSPAKNKVDKAAGRIAITAADEKGFTYGQQVFVTGVHVKSGVSVSQAVPVGLTQSADSFETTTAGFVDKNDPTKLLKELPKNFAEKTYYFVCQTKDQNGNLLDINESKEYTAEGLTFVSNDPTKLTFDANQIKSFTIKNEKGDTVDYTGIMVNPAIYSDKGGEVSINAIGKKTGKNTSVIVRIGEAAQVAEIALSVPKDVVADGDKNVVIPFEAKDTNGNKVTNYETLVRTGNGIMLTASDGTLSLEEQNDGSAKLLWSDNAQYDRETEAAYTKSSTYDNLGRPIILMANVLGGKNSQVQMDVQDMRIPNVITGTKLDSYVADKGETVVDPFGVDPDDKDKLNFTYVDQYNKEVSKKEALAFFTAAAKDGFRNREKYGVKVIIPSNAKMTSYSAVKDFKGHKILWMGGTQKLTLDAEDAVVRVDANGKKTYETSEETYKFSVARFDVSNNKNNIKDGSDWDTGTKPYSQTITAVPMNDVNDLSIFVDQNGVKRTQVAIEAEYNAKEEDAKKADFNGAGESSNRPGSKSTAFLVADEIKIQRQHEISVNGKFKGNNVKVPVDWIYEGNNSRFRVDHEDSSLVASTYKLKLPTELQALADGSAAIKSSQFYDFSKYGNPAKDATMELSIAVAKEDSGENIGSDLKGALSTAATAANEAGKKSEYDTAKKELKAEIDKLNTFKKDDVKTAADALDAAIKVDTNFVQNGGEYSRVNAAWPAIYRAVKNLDYTDAEAVDKLIGEKAGILVSNPTAITTADYTSGSLGEIGTLYNDANKGTGTIKDEVDALITEIYNQVAPTTTFVGKIYNLSKDYNIVKAWATGADSTLGAADVTKIKDAWDDFKDAYAAFVKGAKSGDYTTILDSKAQTAFLTAAGTFDKAVNDVGLASAPSVDFGNDVDAINGHAYAATITAYNAAVAKEDAGFVWKTTIDLAAENDKTSVSYETVIEEYNKIKAVPGVAVVGSKVDALTAKMAEWKEGATNDKDVDTVLKKVTNVRQDVVLNASESTPVTIEFDKTKTLKPEDMMLAYGTTKNDGKLAAAPKGFIGSDSDTSIKAAVVKDQYGYETKDEVVYTISDYKQTPADSKLYEFTHVNENVLFQNNGSANPSVTYAEIGDTFKVTAKVKGKTLSAVCNVTVGSDVMAKITNEKDFDKDFRKGEGDAVYGLGYIK